jgi:hypothetical protein
MSQYTPSVIKINDIYEMYKHNHKVKNTRYIEYTASKFSYFKCFNRANVSLGSYKMYP